MMELHDKLYAVTSVINLINATIEVTKEKRATAIWEEDVYLAHYFANELVKLNEFLDKKYEEQEKIYKELIIEVL